MKKIIVGAVLLIIGIVIGWLCRGRFLGDAPAVQRDTTVVYDTVRYSRLELDYLTYRLDLPKIGNKEYVFVREDSTTVIYRDSVRYVTLPRQFFYTRTAEAEIFHSGIDSRIDSLNVYMRNTSITQVIRPREKKHSIGIGIEANYASAFNMPVQLEYSYMVRPWLSVYGYAEYEPFRRQFGVGMGTKVLLEW